MKIIFLIPPSPDKKKIIRWIDCSQETKASYLWQPNDYIIISSLLKPKDDLCFVDGTADSFSETMFFEAIGRLSGNMLFFAMSTVCWKSDLYFFQKTKKIFPDIPVFVIGDIVMEKYYRALILNESNGLVTHPYLLDLEKMSKVTGIGNNTLPGVCTALEQEVFPKSKNTTFIEGNTPRHEIFLKHGYCFPFAKHFKFSQVTTMWGCPFSCSYCPDSKIAPTVRHYEGVLSELEYLSKLGVKELFFADKVFGFPEKNSVPLLEKMSERFNFSWSCYFHPQLYNPRLLELMNSAGCHTIIIGIDTYNLSSLKQYKRVVRREKIEGVIAHANRLGMNICGDFILGLENETETDILNTIKYAMELSIDYASFNIAAPCPGSIIREEAIKKGCQVTDMEGFDSLGDYGCLSNKYIDGKRLKKLRSKAVRSFYFRPLYLLRRLRKTSSLEHLHIQFNNMLALLNKSR